MLSPCLCIPYVHCNGFGRLGYWVQFQQNIIAFSKVNWKNSIGLRCSIYFSKGMYFAASCCCRAFVCCILVLGSSLTPVRAFCESIVRVAWISMDLLLTVQSGKQFLC